ncbi:MAG: glutamine amidotransferase [Rhodospirillales bacterium]|jgi:putative intracellular protease/amidase|uniref:type 1 glutamine amidotransferase domain-containing protein n=1 Tax=Hwanghaeella sp. 1Z406 TaxID=3402811 RepID=UPI000C95B6FB|nr:glutamine amidotransferase [Rhodospirillales bacterium]|tara:strand:+ start:84903 stop:85622 length:720 start_codon:yes stop_codon:yes gene_type:complete
MADPKKVAIIVTSHASMGDTGEKTGVWLEEFTTPYYHLRDAGLTVDVFSVAGGDIPIDPRSVEGDAQKEESVARYLKDERLQTTVKTTPSVDQIDLDGYDAVFFPGGHGTMWDYPPNGAIAEVVSQGLDAGKIIATVCHGPACLVNAKTKAGAPVVKGRRVTGFSNSEEKAAGLTDVVPFLLETKLRELGAMYESVDDFQPFAIRDGDLITGQNPASAKKVADSLIEALTHSAKRREVA